MDLILAAMILAHHSPSGWLYPQDCCSSVDCAEVPDNRVRYESGEFVVVLRRGEHPMVTGEEIIVRIPADRARPSPDGHFHICLNVQERLIRNCFWAPGGDV